MPMQAHDFIKYEIDNSYNLDRCANLRSEARQIYCTHTTNARFQCTFAALREDRNYEITQKAFGFTRSDSAPMFGEYKSSDRRRDDGPKLKLRTKEANLRRCLF